MGGPLVLHLLTAASLPELLRLQLRLSPGPAAAPPPLSSLGLQLCRSTGDPRDFRRDVKGMTEASIPLQFDGDCIYKQLVAAANSSRCHLRGNLREVLVLGLASQREVSMPVCGTRVPDTDTAGDSGQLCLH